MSNVEHEPVAFLDLTGSMSDPIVPGSSTKRIEVLHDAFYEFVVALKESDDAATDATLSGNAEKEGGGILTYTFQQKVAKRLSDVNPSNYSEKVTNVIKGRGGEWLVGGQTYVMPAIALWQEDRDEEFSSDEVKDINREFDLMVFTDGMLYDEGLLLDWIQRSPSNHKVFFGVMGSGPDNADAVADYRRVAQASNGKVTVLDMQNVTDAIVLAKQMLQAIS